MALWTWSSGQQCSPGAMGKSASSVLATMRAASGVWRPGSRLASLALFLGKASRRHMDSKLHLLTHFKGCRIITVTESATAVSFPMSSSASTTRQFLDMLLYLTTNAWLAEYWYDRQVGSNQYGLGGRTERNWGTDSLEGVLSAEELAENRADQTIDTAKYKFRDEEYYKSRDYDLADIEVPVLSVANWGAIHLHLRGNIFGYLGIGSKLKYLRFITGRHDLPFYYDEEVAVQKSFLDAFLKGVDPEGWSTPGKLPPVSLCIRRDNPGFNNPKAERDAFPRRPEMEWPLARTVYTDFHFCKSMGLERSSTSGVGEGLVTYTAPKGGVTFVSAPFEEETEMTGHPIVRLSVSAEADGDKVPSEIDVFATLRHIDANGKEGKFG